MSVERTLLTVHLVHSVTTTLARTGVTVRLDTMGRTTSVIVSPRFVMPTSYTAATVLRQIKPISGSILQSLPQGKHTSKRKDPLCLRFHV